MSLLIGIAGQELGATERTWLLHPAVAGVILFSRNLGQPDQVRGLIAELRARRPELLVAIDQEGGPVQRLRHGVTILPALATIGTLYRRAPRAALRLARAHAEVMAAEMLALGFDLSLAPVADLGRGNRAIGARAFDPDPRVCAVLVATYVRAMRRRGMAATLKHFPGHGSVLPDSHVEVACDARPLEVLAAEDLLPFAAGIAAGARAVMLAHVRYPALAPKAAGYAPEVIALLRTAFGFSGVVMGDDVSMVGAEEAGTVADRVRAHLDAGCTLVLACQPDAVEAALGAVDRPYLSRRGQATLRARDPLAARQWLDGDAYRRRRRALEAILEQT